MKNIFTALSFVLFTILIIPLALGSSPDVTSPTQQSKISQKKLIIAVTTEPQSLDISNASQPSGWPILLNIYDMLIDKARDGKLVPGIATWNASADGKEIAITIKRGVKFHSGDPLTTKDIQFSFERAKVSVPYKTTLASVDRIEIVNDYNAKVIFKSPDVRVLAFQGFPIVSKTYFDRVGEEKYVKEPVGTGPYKFVGYAPGQFIEVMANIDYWGAKPSVQAARFVFIKEDTTRVSMLKADEADIVMEIPFTMYSNVKNTAGLKTVDFQSNHPTPSIHFHTLNPNVPWYKKQVRSAIASAIDADAIIKNLLFGLPAHYAFLAPYEVGYDPNLKPYSYDPNKSKKLLAEAGYPNGFQMPLYYSIGRMAMQKETAEAIVLYLNNIGIRAKPEGIEFVQYQERGMQSKKSTSAEWVSLGGLPIAAQQDPTVALAISFWSGAPLALYSNPEVDKLIDQGRATLDDTKRALLVKNAVSVIHDDVACIPIWNNVSIYGMKSNIDFTPTNVPFSLMLLKDVTVK